MKQSMIQAHMRAAYAYAQTSHCVRLQVGCVVVDTNPHTMQDTVVSIGYNGTPSGEDNVCELPDNTTKPSVIHAEDNALRKLMFQANGMSLFCTTSPCLTCAELIRKSGITSVYYGTIYRMDDGIQYLHNNGIEVHQVVLN